MNTNLLKVGLRNSALYLPDEALKGDRLNLSEATSSLVANALKLGFVFDEDLLIGLNRVVPAQQLHVLQALKEVKGVNKNWTPLVKGWDVPTGESVFDHIVTLFSNVIGSKKGTRLQCGHVIPDHTFPLDRYNGCPFCGTPFEKGEIEHYGQGSKYTVLKLWTEADLEAVYRDLLTSRTPLDATQVESLQTLLDHFELPDDVQIGMKETLMLVVDTLVENDRDEEAGKLFSNPNEVLRYLWYKHTGFLQLVEPKTIIERMSANSGHIYAPADRSAQVKLKVKAELKLKYARPDGRRVAAWLNSIDMPAEKACEIMHPKREMWVRFIRALRLAEHSKRKGFERLAELMDVFYNQNYSVYQGELQKQKLRYDFDRTFNLLKQRPGLFARSLFSTMLWFGPKDTLVQFREVAAKVPARLLFTLVMYAPTYFSNSMRSVKPLGGTRKRIPANKLLELYDKDQINTMLDDLEQFLLDEMRTRYAREEAGNRTIYIEPALAFMPVAIGERSETVQDLPAAQMGQRFPVEGNTVRLFMQWGTGLAAQHLDMDLSCKVAFRDHTEYCSYSQLTLDGCKHSGDIQRIPHMVGTAEYIDVDLKRLAKRGARFVTFTCNAYTHGALANNMVVGWMDSKHEMKVSHTTGVAYDPSCVQHQVRIEKGLSKGLVFGVLDVEARELVWLEMSFHGQLVQGLDVGGVEALLNKLRSRLNIGQLLTLKAEAQGLTLVETPAEADEVYDTQWALNAAAVSQLLID